MDKGNNHNTQKLKVEVGEEKQLRQETTLLLGLSLN